METIVRYPAVKEGSVEFDLILLQLWSNIAFSSSWPPYFKSLQITSSFLSLRSHIGQKALKNVSVLRLSSSYYNLGRTRSWEVEVDFSSHDSQPSLAFSYMVCKHVSLRRLRKTRQVVSNTRSIIVFRRFFLLLFFGDYLAWNRHRRIPAVSCVKQKFTKYAQTNCLSAYTRYKMMSSVLSCVPLSSLLKGWSNKTLGTRLLFQISLDGKKTSTSLRPT